MNIRGGRPLLDPRHKRTARIEIKCTAADKALLIQQANRAGQKVSSYMLMRTLGKKIPVNRQKYLRELHALNLELARSGTNLNQLARYANTMLQLGHLNGDVIDQLQSRLDHYNQQQVLVREAFRKIVRELSRN